MKLTQCVLVGSLLLGGAGTLAAQEMPQGAHMPPKVLNIAREFTRPGKAGSTHEKAESAFVQAMRNAKWPTHYLAMESLTGKPRALFFTGYDSFEAMEKDVMATQKNETLSSALERAEIADGELLSDSDTGDFVFREDYSLRPETDVAHMRYFDISLFHVRPGHEKEWDTLVKMYTKGFERIADTHWVTYEQVYGQQGGTFIVITPMKSAAEIDRNAAQGKQFEEAMGAEGMKKIAELSAATIESSTSNLFAFNPRMSYASDEWVKADPDFWKAKPSHATAKKPAEKSETKKE